MCVHQLPHAEQQPQCLCEGTTKTFWFFPCIFLLHPTFRCVYPLCVSPRGPRETAEGEPPVGLTCICFCVSLPPSDRRRYEAGTGLRVSAALRTLWRRAELQTLCFRPHASHTLHAGGGDDQLVVVCMSFSAVYLTAVCLQMIQPVKIGTNFHTQMSHFPEWSRLSGAASSFS